MIPTTSSFLDQYNLYKTSAIRVWVKFPEKEWTIVLFVCGCVAVKIFRSLFGMQTDRGTGVATCMDGKRWNDQEEGAAAEWDSVPQE